VHTVVAWLFLALAPLSVGAAAFLWHLHGLDRFSTGSRSGLSLAFAIVGSVAAAVALYLGLISAFYLAGWAEVVGILGSGVLPAFVILEALPIVLAAYLRWLGRR
jgi:hypothetical protein